MTALKQTLLLVEDHAPLAQTVGSYLEASGFIVDYAADGLTDKLEGFDAGADDYLVKPFDLPELEARIRSLIRRGQGDVYTRAYVVADLVLDVDAAEVRRAGQRIRLSPKQFEMLHLLMRESPNVVSRESIERQVWGDALPDSDALSTARGVRSSWLASRVKSRSRSTNALRRVVKRSSESIITATSASASWRSSSRLSLMPLSSDRSERSNRSASSTIGDTARRDGR